MNDEHWFDALNKAVVRHTPRRRLLPAAASAVVARLALRGSAAKAKKGKKGKGKSKNQGRKPRNRRQCGPEIQAACDSAFSLALHTPDDIKFCKDKCERCKQAGTPFCILGSDGAERATCCHAAEECCGSGLIGDCCTSDRCCAGADGGAPTCAPPGEYCCRNGTGDTCPYGAACCGNGGCLTCDAPEVPNPATCECQLPDDCCTGAGSGYACCNGNCIHIEIDDLNCGGCNQACAGEGERCCASACVDARIDPNNCGQCGNSQPGHLCCNRRLWPDDQYHCCQHENGFHPCPNIHDCCVFNGSPYCCQQ